MKKLKWALIVCIVSVLAWSGSCLAAEFIPSIDLEGNEVFDVTYEDPVTGEIIHIDFTPDEDGGLVVRNESEDIDYWKEKVEQSEDIKSFLEEIDIWQILIDDYGYEEDELKNYSVVQILDLDIWGDVLEELLNAQENGQDLVIKIKQDGIKEGDKLIVIQVLPDGTKVILDVEALDGAIELHFDSIVEHSTLIIMKENGEIIVPTEEPMESSTEADNPHEQPGTPSGDSNHLIAWLLILVVAIAAVGVIVVRRKRK